MSLLNTFSPTGEAIDLSTTDYTPANYVGVYVGAAGDVKLDTVEAGTITVPAQAGGVLPWAVRKVYKTGTTASSLFSIKLP